MDALGELFSILVATAIFCLVFFLIMFVIARIISNINYFFKWRKLSPAARAYEKRIRNRYGTRSNGANGWWTSDSGSSGSTDCGDSGGDGGGGGCD